MTFFDKGTNNAPRALDWLLSGSVRSYADVGNPNDSGSSASVHVDNTLAKLAEETGAGVVVGNGTSTNYADDQNSVKLFEYCGKGNSKDSGCCGSSDGA